MAATKADIIAQLQRDILPLQGLKSSLYYTDADVWLGPVNRAFPNSVFPKGAVHEFFCEKKEDGAATNGFISGILSFLMKKNTPVVWISVRRTIFPPALKFFGIDPGKIIFVNAQKEKHLLWCMEEALKCEGLGAVIGEIPDLSFTASRRLQLAVEESNVTGFIIRHQPKNLTTSCVSRWRITSLPIKDEEDLPGIGFPAWNVQLIKIRNGRPGSWQMMWRDNRFQEISKIASVVPLQKRKIV